jgi:colanic acid/amylovoran biosynthesis glycosyltransferase
VDFFFFIIKRLKILEVIIAFCIGREATKYGADPASIHTIYTSVKNELIKEDISGKASTATLNIITVGRFHWKKGYNYLIEALGMVKKINSDFQLRLIAGKDIPEEIVFSIHQNQLQENITILGNLSHEEVLNFMKSADVMILPSVEEGIANVVVEAMAVGTPVISSDCGGMPELVTDGVNGYLFKSRDTKELAQKIIDFQNMKQRDRNELTANARKTIEERFTRERMLDQFEKFYA